MGIIHSLNHSLTHSLTHLSTKLDISKTLFDALIKGERISRKLPADRCESDTRPEKVNYKTGREKTWVSEWVNEWVCESPGTWVNGWVSEWASEWASEWVSEWVSELCLTKKSWVELLSTGRERLSSFRIFQKWSREGSETWGRWENRGFQKFWGSVSPGKISVHFRRRTEFACKKMRPPWCKWYPPPPPSLTGFSAGFSAGFLLVLEKLCVFAIILDNSGELFVRIVLNNSIHYSENSSDYSE